VGGIWCRDLACYCIYLRSCHADKPLYPPLEVRSLHKAILDIMARSKLLVVGQDPLCKFSLGQTARDPCDSPALSGSAALGTEEDFEGDTAL